MRLVGEWKPLHLATDPIGLASMALICGVGYAYAFTRSKRSISEILVQAVFLTSMIQHNRNYPIWALSCSLLAAPHFRSALDRTFRRTIRRIAASQKGVLLSVACGIALIAMSAIASVRLLQQTRSLCPRYGHGFVSDITMNEFMIARKPEQAVRFMQSLHFPFPMRLMTDYDDGGFLIFRLPLQPVFVDGREDLYLGPFLDRYTDMVLDEVGRQGLSPNDDAFLQAFDFDGVLTGDPIIAGWAQAQPDMELVYADFPGTVTHGNHWIFLRRRPELAALIARCRRAGLDARTAPGGRQD
jgi:hypothetical protein